MSDRIEIISTAHWDGDPRLNRHVEYLQRAGHRAVLVSFAGVARSRSLFRALGAIRRSEARVVLLPDPELFVLGSLTARLSGKRPIIDIHEDYSKAARARTWIPEPLRPLVGFLARVNERLGRWASWRTVVAAPELRRADDYLATNVPDPAAMTFREFEGSHLIVYIGDLTEARGAVEMIEVLAALDTTYELLVVGPAPEETLRGLRAKAGDLGVLPRVHFVGRQSHAEAWSLAAGALVGLNLLADVPAYREAVATKLWEYMAVGIPPVVSDLPGQRRVVSELDDRLICRDPSEAAAAIVELASDIALRRELGSRARHIAETAWGQARPDLAIQSIVEP